MVGYTPTPPMGTTSAETFEILLSCVFKRDLLIDSQIGKERDVDRLFDVIARRNNQRVGNRRGMK